MTKNAIRSIARCALLGFALAPGAAFAAQPKTYQVTGPVLELTDDVITVQKGKEKWEIARTADTKVNGELKVGAKVTIEYRMAAASVEVKGGAAAGKKAEAPATPKAAAPKKSAAAPNQPLLQ
jgi:hypothetical protein